MGAGSLLKIAERVSLGPKCRGKKNARIIFNVLSEAETTSELALPGRLYGGRKVLTSTCHEKCGS